MLVSRFTSGYFYGLLASVVGVIGVNYIFTYPYFAFNFTISGYPLTFLVMLAVSIVVSALTTQIKQQEKLRAEAEKEKMRGNLLRAVSHDIRTPLTSIVGGVNAIWIPATGCRPRRRPPCSPTSARRRNGSSAWWKICSPSRASPVRPPSIRSWRPGKSCSAPPERQVPQALPGDHGLHPRAGGAADDPDGRILIEQVLINLMENAALHGDTTTRIELISAARATSRCF